MHRAGQLLLVAMAITAVAFALYAYGQGAQRDWRSDAVSGLSSAGVDAAFPDGSFLSEETLTGYQAAVLVARMLDSIGARAGCPDPRAAMPAPEASFSDVPGDHWAASAVADVARLGVADAFPEGEFRGQGFLSGYQTALILSRIVAVLDDSVECGVRADAALVASLQSEVDELQAARIALAGTVEAMELQVASLMVDLEAGTLRGPEGPPGLRGEQGVQGEVGPGGSVGPAGPAGEPGLQGVVGPAGEEGPEGPGGPAGELGPRGLAGIPGPEGARGESGFHCWDVDMTGAMESHYDVNLDGVIDVRDCIGPAGPQGPLGPQGAVGSTGPAGPAGASGPAGPAGPLGPVGAVGPAGQSGPTGPIGPMGARGEEGPQGEPGSDGPVGATGAAGQAGATGSMGLTGPAGPTGPMGLVGLTGPTGPAGPTGAAGAAGPAGPVGPAGPTGPKGDTGEDGQCICIE